MVAECFGDLAESLAGVLLTAHHDAHDRIGEQVIEGHLADREAEWTGLEHLRGVEDTADVFDGVHRIGHELAECGDHLGRIEGVRIDDGFRFDRGDDRSIAAHHPAIDLRSAGHGCGGGDGAAG